MATRTLQRQHIWRYLIGLVLWVMAIEVYAANLTSEVDRSTVNLGESFELTVTYSEQVLFGEPDFSALEKDFNLLSRNQQSKYSNINGNTTSFTQWVLMLSPKRAGSLLIPSFTFKNEVSDALEIQANQAKPSTQLAGAPVFTETVLDKNSVYVQEQALLTLRLYTSVPMNNFSMSELSIPGAQLLKVAENQYQKDVEGKQYMVVETRYAIFADSSSLLEIPAVQYSGVIPQANTRHSGSLFRQRGKQAFFHSEAKHLDVKPRPDNHTQPYWLPGKGLGLQERWSQSSDDITLGEPLTRTITLTGQNLMANQLPPLQIPTSKNYKLYPDQAQMEDSVNENGVLGKRIESIAIVPTQVGSITLPDITVHWWDTEANVPRQTVLKGRTLNVLPPANNSTESAANATALTGNSDALIPPPQLLQNQSIPVKNLYIWLLAASNIVLLIVAAGFAILWWRNRPSMATTPAEDTPAVSDKALFKEIRIACAKENYPGLRQAIINWARVYWQHDHLHSLEQVAKLAENEELSGEFSALDKRLYSSSKSDTQEPVNCEVIFQVLERLKKTGAARAEDHKKDKRQHLRPLYPDNNDANI